MLAGEGALQEVAHLHACLSCSQLACAQGRMQVGKVRGTLCRLHSLVARPGMPGIRLSNVSVVPGEPGCSRAFLACTCFNHGLVLLLQGPHVSRKLGGERHAARQRQRANALHQRTMSDLCADRHS